MKMMSLNKRTVAHVDQTVNRTKMRIVNKLLKHRVLSELESFS